MLVVSFSKPQTKFFYTEHGIDLTSHTIYGTRIQTTDIPGPHRTCFFVALGKTFVQVTSKATKMDLKNKIKVQIPTVTTVGSYTLYDLEISVELNKYKTERYRISKRYSDFVQLKDTIERKQQVKLPDLPSKYASLYKSNETLLNERKEGLTKFAKFILNGPRLNGLDEVLTFFNIPKSVIAELNMLSNNKTSNGRIGSSGSSISTVNRIDSAQQWMEVFKNVKSLLQDARTKMFSNGNVVEIRKNLKTAEGSIELLKSYLSNTLELGMGEIRRRRELLTPVNKELSELNSMVLTMKFNSVDPPVSSSSSNLTNMSSTSAAADDLFKTGSVRSGSSRRTFGKLKETTETKKLDNVGLLQMQQQEMKNQDQNLDTLKEMILRQKQIGIAVNEELTIQNELLDSLNQEVDQSTTKLHRAKNKVNKLL